MKGMGKAYWDNGMLMYDGEFNDNNYNGRGRLYSKDGALRYNCWFINGEPLVNTEI